jgi:hypothetical protein
VYGLDHKGYCYFHFDGVYHEALIIVDDVHQVWMLLGRNQLLSLVLVLLLLLVDGRFLTLLIDVLLQFPIQRIQKIELTRSI